MVVATDGGGVGRPGAATATLAEAVPPVPPSTEVTALVVLFFAPAVVAVTFTLKVHEALDARVALARLMLLDPVAAVIVPPPQLPVSPIGVETTSPDGNVSVKPTPLNVEALGLLMVKLSDVDPPTAMLATPKDFVIVGGATAITTPVGIRPMRLPASSVNHRLPSGPAVIPSNPAAALTPAPNTVTTPSDGRREPRSLRAQARR